MPAGYAWQPASQTFSPSLPTYTFQQAAVQDGSEGVWNPMFFWWGTFVAGVGAISSTSAGVTMPPGGSPPSGYLWVTGGQVAVGRPACGCRITPLGDGWPELAGVSAGYSTCTLSVAENPAPAGSVTLTFTLYPHAAEGEIRFQYQVPGQEPVIFADLPGPAPPIRATFTPPAAGTYVITASTSAPIDYLGCQASLTLYCGTTPPAGATTATTAQGGPYGGGGTPINLGSNGREPPFPFAPLSGNWGTAAVNINGPVFEGGIALECAARQDHR